MFEGWQPRLVQQSGDVGWILWGFYLLVMAVLVLGVDLVMAALRWVVAHL